MTVSCLAVQYRGHANDSLAATASRTSDVASLHRQFTAPNQLHKSNCAQTPETSRETQLSAADWDPIIVGLPAMDGRTLMPSPPTNADVLHRVAVVRPRSAAPTSLELTAYRAVTWAARPAAGLILRLRERRGKEDPDRKGERLGLSSLPRPQGQVVWVHAASVGEANSVLPLVAGLTERRPGITVLLTTGTVTSARSVARRLPVGAIHQYVPLDAPQLVARFLSHWQPSLAVFTEQEIWPNLIMETRARGIPLALVNARMSEGSFERWQKRRALAKALFSSFSMVLAQSEAFAGRFAALGAEAARAVGNLKIDAPALPVNAAELEKLEAALAGRPRFVAASTHPGEEMIIAAAHRLLAARIPGFATIIAPRHPERGPALSEALKLQGFDVALRSAGVLPSAGTDIYIADTIGELGTFYAATHVAFIGGSLIARGGQNPIEAVRHNAAVLTGPHWVNFVEAYEALLARGGAAEVQNAADICAGVADLLADSAALEKLRREAQAALAELGGALERTLQALLPMLPIPGDISDEAARAAT